MMFIDFIRAKSRLSSVILVMMFSDVIRARGKSKCLDISECTVVILCITDDVFSSASLLSRFRIHWVLYI